MLKSSNASFWLESDFFDDDKDEIRLGLAKPKGKDPMKLAGYRRAIGNFVTIVTGENIPVKFNTSGGSYTDGKTVTISASLKDKDFDPAVGLALHEGSHIKLTDFDVLVGLEGWVKNHDIDMISLAEKHGANDDAGDPDRWWSSGYVLPKLKDLINIIEDRRIDAWVYKNAPGYKGYYQALYDKYFNASIIDKGLKSDEYTDANWDSFMFRVCNLTNPNRRLDVLGLKEIWNMIDLKNIARLQNTVEVRDLAFEVFKFIEDQIPSLELDKEEEECKGQKGKGGECEGDGGGDPIEGNKVESPDGKDELDDGSKAKGDEAKKGSGGKGGNNIMPKGLDELNDKQRHRLKKAIEKQKAFQDQETKKTNVSKSLQKQMKALEESGTEITPVEYESQNRYMDNGIANVKVDVAVIKNFTKGLVDNLDCGMWDTNWGVEGRKIQIEEGIRRGVVLGKKLKIRAEERDTKFNKLRSGKIDKRMIANAGYGAEAIFEKIENFAYKPGIIHISIDNSGSMSGGRLRQAMKTTAAIAKACSMIDNMEVVVSARSADNVGHSREYIPVIAIIYDSRKDHLSKLINIMPQVNACGTTPEGLCFSALMDEIVNASRGKDSYFINMCDGMPYFNGYRGESAMRHTKLQVGKMRKEGIKVISYFITGSHGISDYEREAFNAMYGKDAQYINTKKINDVAKSMNRKFLEVA